MTQRTNADMDNHIAVPKKENLAKPDIRFEPRGGVGLTSRRWLRTDFTVRGSWLTYEACVPARDMHMATHPTDWPGCRPQQRMHASQATPCTNTD